MPSFDAVNYGLRPSKNIQRQIIFQGIRTLQVHLGVEQKFYVGFGSIWFTDFLLAHKVLDISDMVSIEKDEIGFRRAKFNAPYRTVKVRRGNSTDVLQDLFSERSEKRPWVIWLDYDDKFNEVLRDDCRVVVEKAPENTIFLITFNGNGRGYGSFKDRPMRLRDLFQDVVPDNLGPGQCKEGELQETLANMAISFMRSVAAGLRYGGFVPAFRVLYKDSVEMVTVGGILPSKDARGDLLDRVSQSDWKCKPSEVVVAPHLTIQEAIALQSQLPRPKDSKLNRDLVRSLGFDLGEDQIKAFERYYREYPAFAQIVM